jgi:hypothetical protein
MGFSIRELYAYALAEGEGVGTAYEYYAKRRVMMPLLDALPPRSRVVVAGLPERYGASMDLLLVAWERGATATVLDDRPAALERARSALGALQGEGLLRGLDVAFRRVASIEEAGGDGAAPPYDAVFSCEVLQRVEVRRRASYLAAARRLAPRGIVFAPNAENRSHLAISGLAGLDRGELVALAEDPADRTGFVDMPPFPPGIRRSEEQRQRARAGRLEAVAMRVLEAYARAEHFVPRAIKRRVAHIVYLRWRARR